MLKLVKITKDYEVADTKVRALKGLDLCFRKNEFVSILGPSGCGKTTLLNIIGGLDHCTSGDLTIYGKSTKQYSDRDWDIYRNHRVGFVFQSYNLIPHQTVLGNVELALTIAGMSKDERVSKAKAALDKVGLSDQYYKKPNQLSGGQCQRVAIARSLVNDPEILLADEPTGALDTVTSKQIMDLIQEIAKERLVIMVTHNPELAEEYSTRIIKLLDGNLLNDSNPFSEADEKEESNLFVSRQIFEEKEEHAKALASGKKHKKKEKAKMSFWTSFKLSLQNLFTKKRRTAMTAIAGSIGIIGVSLVLSISIGIQGFIGDMQSDMLAGNPVEVSQTAFDINALMGGMSTAEKKEIAEKGDWVNVESMIDELNQRFSSMQNMMIENEINKNYVTYLTDMPEEYWSAIYQNYGLDVSNSIYTNFSYPTQESGRKMSLGGIQAMYGSVLQYIEEFEQFASLIGSLSNPFVQAPDTRIPVTEDYVLSQYNVLYKQPGHESGIAKEANEIMVVLDKDRLFADLTLGQIGYYSQDEFINIVNMAIGNEYNADIYDGGKIEYSALASQQFTWYPNNTIFDTKDPSSSFPFEYRPYADSSWDNGLPLTVVGIIEPKDELSYGMLSSGIYYTTALAERIVETNWESDLANYLREEKTESLSGTAMIMRKGTERTDDNGDTILDANGNPLMYPSDVIIPLAGAKLISYEYEYFYGEMIAPEKSKGLIDGGSNGMMSTMLSLFGMGGSGVSSVSYSMQLLGGNVDSAIERNDTGSITKWEVNKSSEGEIFALPNSIALYAKNLSQKDNMLAWLDAWNSNDNITLSDGTVLTPEQREDITYSDMLSLIMGMISTLVDMITIALVGFTSLALVVSCVMIAIITYVSVVERIKEIGVIRSLGGRKKDVSNLFTAETFIIGLVSGLIGIVITYILSFLINFVVGLLDVAAIASFPWWVALIMVGVSMGLTWISGILPSKSAAKKDPVVALRTE